MKWTRVKDEDGTVRYSSGDYVIQKHENLAFRAGWTVDWRLWRRSKHHKGARLPTAKRFRTLKEAKASAAREEKDDVKDMLRM